MGADTNIEWCEATWNPLTGCTKVSPGCDNCYAKTMHERFNGAGSFDTVTLHPERLDQPLRWRKPRKVFVNSMSDLFHKDVTDDYVAEVFAVMAMAPRHTFQVLTKRHARMKALLTSKDFERRVAELTGKPEYVKRGPSDWSARWTWPLPNVWLGVSVENQQFANLRIPALLNTPAAVRFLSCEPLLGPVNLDPWRNLGDEWNGRSPADTRLDWVIVGGESGRNARPMHPDWARRLRDQCVSAGVPFLFKQWGEWGPAGTWQGPDHHITPDGALYAPGEKVDARLGDIAAMHRWGKKAAGRLLYGRTWDEYPAAVA